VDISTVLDVVLPGLSALYKLTTNMACTSDGSSATLNFFGRDTIFSGGSAATCPNENNIYPSPSKKSGECLSTNEVTFFGKKLGFSAQPLCPVLYAFGLSAAAFAGIITASIIVILGIVLYFYHRARLAHPRNHPDAIFAPNANKLQLNNVAPQGNGPLPYPGNAPNNFSGYPHAPNNYPGAPVNYPSSAPANHQVPGHAAPPMPYPQASSSSQNPGYGPPNHPAPGYTPPLRHPPQAHQYPGGYPQAPR